MVQIPAPVRTWLVPFLGAFMVVLTWFDVQEMDPSPRLLAIMLLAPAPLLAWPWIRSFAPLASMWIVAYASAVLDVRVDQGWDVTGLLFWVSLVSSAIGVAAWRPRSAFLMWAGIDLAAATSLGGTRDTSFLGELFWVGGIGGGVFLAARLVHRYREQAITLRAQALLLEREREEHARLAAAEERARIARELHDVVAHSISVMVMHAGAVRRLLRDEQADERAALESLEETGRASMTEIRRALGVLRRPDEPAERAPQAGLANLEQLVEQLRGAGLDVALLVEGDRVAVASGVDLAAYRIAQEALTNVVKHAAGARVEVRLRYLDDAIEVDVVDDGGRGRRDPDDTPGYGLVGLRERATVLGGTLTAGERPGGGGFQVRARLPLEVAT